MASNWLSSEQVTNVGWVHIEISTEAFRLLVVPCFQRNHGIWKVLSVACIQMSLQVSGRSREGARGAHPPHFWTYLWPEGPRKKFF